MVVRDLYLYYKLKISTVADDSIEDLYYLQDFEFDSFVLFELDGQPRGLCGGVGGGGRRDILQGRVCSSIHHLVV